MEQSSGDGVVSGGKPKSDIPVCNIFSDESPEKLDSFLATSTTENTQNMQELVEQDNAMESVKEPTLCNVFGKDTDSSLPNDDIFSKISDIEEKKSLDSPENSGADNTNESNLSPPAMETLRLNRSVDSFIVEDMTESDPIGVNNSTDEIEQPSQADIETDTKEELGVTEEDVDDITTQDSPKPIIASPSFVSITSFSISPDEIPEEPVDILEDESINIQSDTLEKLTLNDDDNETSQSSGIEAQDPAETMHFEIGGNMDEPVLSNEKEPFAESFTTGSLFSSIATENDIFASVSGSNNAKDDEDDPFAAALSNSESNRRSDAWLPSDDTRAILTATVINQRPPDIEMEKITSPGLSTSELLEDPVKELVVRMTGSENILKRENLTINDVSHNKDGVQKLIDSGNLRGAANLCMKLLATHGQGFGHATQISTHTPETLQLWYNRILVLTKLKLFESASAEIALFKDLDNPDLYYDYYPDVYPGRRGSMVSFSFRLLHAEFPRHVDKPEESLNRLHKILGVCEKILRNLKEGKTEIGEMTVLNPSDSEASIELWTKRKLQTLFSIGNTLMQLKDYSLAVEIYNRILKIHPEEAVTLQSGIGRIYLHLGDIRSAQQIFTEAEKAGTNHPQHKVQLILNRGFMYIGTNNWKEALAQFELALTHEPHNIIALNNKAVCMLYLGRLKDAIAALEAGTCEQTTTEVASKVTNLEWQQTMLQGLLSNLSTLYELESSRYLLKKRALFLKQIAPTCSDSFDTSCFKEI